MKTEIKKKEQAMMCAEDLKINNTNIKLNNVKNKKLNTERSYSTPTNGFLLQEAIQY